MPPGPERIAIGRAEISIQEMGFVNVNIARAVIMASAAAISMVCVAMVRCGRSFYWAPPADSIYEECTATIVRPAQSWKRSVASKGALRISGKTRNDYVR